MTPLPRNHHSEYLSIFSTNYFSEWELLFVYCLSHQRCSFTWMCSWLSFSLIVNCSRQGEHNRWVGGGRKSVWGGTQPWTPSTSQSLTEASVIQVGSSPGAPWTPGFRVSSLLGKPHTYTLSSIPMAAGNVTYTYMGRCWKLLIEEWRNCNCALGPWFAQQCQVGWPRAHRFLPRPPGKGRGIWGKAGAGWGR